MSRAPLRLGGGSHGIRRALVASLALAAMLCSGCSQLLSIGRNAVVLGVALDGAPGGGITATVQMYHHGGPPGNQGGTTGGGGGGGGGGSSPSQPTVLTLQGTGPTLPAAVAATQAQTDVRVGFYATDLILVGQSLASRGVRGPFDMFLRDGELSLLAYVAVVAGNAGQLLEKPEPGGTALEMSERLSVSNGSMTGSIPIHFWSFMARLTTPYSAAWAPALAQTANGYRAAGTALFRGDRLVAMVDQADTPALGWLLKSGGFDSLTFPAPNGPGRITLNVSGRTKRLSFTPSGTAVLRLTLDTSVVHGVAASVLSKEGRASLQRAGAAAATSALRRVLDRLQAAGTDVVGFGELKRMRDPAAVADWPATFHTLRIALAVRVRIIGGERRA